VCYIQFSAQTISRVEHVSRLGQTECNGIIRLHRRAHDHPRVAVDARGDVDTEDRLSAVIYHFYSREVQTLDVPCKACPEDCIYNHVGLEQTCLHGVRIGNLSDLYGKLF